MSSVNIGLGTLGVIIGGTAGVIAASLYLFESEPAEVSNFSMPSMQLTEAFDDSVTDTAAPGQPVAGDGNLPPWEPAAGVLTWQDVTNDNWRPLAEVGPATPLPTLPLMVEPPIPSSAIGGVLYESRGGAPQGGGGGGGSNSRSFGLGGPGGGGDTEEPPEIVAQNLAPILQVDGPGEDDPSSNPDNGPDPRPQTPSPSSDGGDPPGDEIPTTPTPTSGNPPPNTPDTGTPNNPGGPGSGPTNQPTPTSIPEPAGWAMLLPGLAALAWRRYRRRTG